MIKALFHLIKFTMVMFMMVMLTHSYAAHASNFTPQLIEQATTQLTKEEKQWLSHKKVLNVAYPQFDYPPYIIHSHEGKVIGIYHDYLKLVATELDVELNIIVLPNILSIEQAFDNNEIDIVVGFTATPVS